MAVLDRAAWVVAPPDPEAVELARALGVPPLLAALLRRRGATTVEAARAFLDPRLEDLSDPLATPGMSEAVEAIADALRSGRRIAVHGDRDPAARAARARRRPALVPPPPRPRRVRVERRRGRAARGAGCAAADRGGLRHHRGARRGPGARPRVRGRRARPPRPRSGAPDRGGGIPAARGGRAPVCRRAGVPLRVGAAAAPRPRLAASRRPGGPRRARHGGRCRSAARR